jgi:predicted ATP-dependent serine protease
VGNTICPRHDSDFVETNWKVLFVLLYQDVFINVVGGLQLWEPAADVAIAVAICSRFSAFYLSKSNEEKTHVDVHS